MTDLPTSNFGEGIIAETVGATREKRREDLNFAKSVYIYRSLFDNLASPQRLGLSGLDLLTAWPAEGSISVTYRLPGDDDLVDLPLIVPADQLYWYNQDFFHQYYGPERPTYYYTHAPVRVGDGDDGAFDLIAEALGRGAILITDCYATDTIEAEFDSWLGPLSDRRLDARVDTLRGEDNDGILHQYIGTVTFDGVPGYAPAISHYERYLGARQHGELTVPGADDVEVAQSIVGEEAEFLWSIYEGPFDALSTGHALRAGFDRRGFMESLADHDVVKVLRRVDGEITTLCLFSMGVSHSPWLSEEYYEEHHREAFASGNIMTFTAMVSDEHKRGSAYAAGLITALTQLLGLRGTTHLITFECNGVSSAYLPGIVEKSALDAPGTSISGLGEPVSRLAFKAISKS